MPRKKNIDIDVSKLMPTNDYIFKKMLGSNSTKELTEAFIQNFVELKDVKIEEVIEDKILEKDLFTEKAAVLDILAKTTNEENINIEMQCGNYDFIQERIVFYLSRTFSIEALKSGDTYEDVNKTIAVLIVKNSLDQLEKIPKYRTVWHFREEEFTSFILTQKMEVVIIELEKVVKAVQKGLLEEKNKVALWANFLLNPKGVDKKVMNSNKDIKMANDKYEEIISDEMEQRRALSRQMYYMDMASAKSEGKKEGIEKGKKENKIEIAKKMIKRNYSIEEIMEITDLTEDEIKSFYDDYDTAH